MKYILFTFLCLVTLSVCHVPTCLAQEQRTIDSINFVIQNGSDTAVVNAKLELLQELEESNIDTVFIVCADILSSIEKIQGPFISRTDSVFALAQGRAWELMGYAHYRRNEFQAALLNNYNALKVFEKLGEQERLADCYLSIGLIHEWQHNEEESIRCYNHALLVYINIDVPAGESACYNNLAWVYYGQGKVELALKFHYQALDIGLEVTDNIQIASSLNSVGTIYMELAETTRSKDSARELLDTALISFQQGFIHLARAGDIPHYDLIDAYIDFANIYFALGELDSAKHYIAKSDKISKYRQDRKWIEKLKYRLFKQEEDYKQALEAFEVYIANRDSLSNEKSQKDAVRQQTKYEFEKNQLIKEQDLMETLRLEKERTRRRDNLQYSIVLICLLGIGLIVAMLGKLSLPARVAEGLIFFAFLIFFEFILVLADPFVDEWTGGAPGLKLLINASIAALIFPLYAFFESKIKGGLAR